MPALTIPRQCEIRTSLVSAEVAAKRFVRSINDALLPATRHTQDDALRKRATPYTLGATDEGRRRLVLHQRVLAEAIHQRPEIANLRIESLYAVCFAELAALGELEDAYRATLTERKGA